MRVIASVFSGSVCIPSGGHHMSEVAELVGPEPALVGIYLQLGPAESFEYFCEVA